MAPRGRQPTSNCYVYIVKQGDIVAYIGKGAGRRAAQSAKRVGGEVEIVRDGMTDEEAFSLERKLIAELMPTENKNSGGTGGRVKPKKISARDAKLKREFEKEIAEIERVGSRVYVAKFLLTRLANWNCERYGVSEVDLDRLRLVSNG